MSATCQRLADAAFPAKRAIAVVLLLALVVRVGYVLETPGYIFPEGARPVERAFDAATVARSRQPPGVPYDPWEYDQIGLSISEGNGFRGKLPPLEADRPPGYPFFLAGIYEVIRRVGHVPVSDLAERVKAARLTEALVNVLTVLLVGLIARELGDRRATLVAMALAAVFPTLVMSGTAYLSEALFVPLVLAATAAALAHRRSRHRLRWALLVGVLAGLAILVRGNAFVLLLPLGLLVWNRRPRLRPAALAAPAAAVALALATAAPWTVRNAYELGGHLVPVAAQAGYALAGTYNDFSRGLPVPRRGAWHRPPRVEPYRSDLRAWAERRLSGLEVEGEMRRQALRFARRHPAYVAEVGLFNTMRLVELGGSERYRETCGQAGFGSGSTDAAVYAFWALALIAIAGAFTPMGRRVPAAVWLVPLVLYGSVVLINSSTPRFRAPIDPFLIVLAAAASVTALTWLPARIRAAASIGSTEM
jgi:hypothetical protein